MIKKIVLLLSLFIIFSCNKTGKTSLVGSLASFDKNETTEQKNESNQNRLDIAKTKNESNTTSNQKADKIENKGITGNELSEVIKTIEDSKKWLYEALTGLLGLIIGYKLKNGHHREKHRLLVELWDIVIAETDDETYSNISKRYRKL